MLLVPPVAGAAPAGADCGSTLAPADTAEIAALSDTSTLGGAPLDRLTDGISRNHRIAEILTSHQDRRGLFPVGLDTVEQDAVLPLQRDPAAFADRDYAHAISLDLLQRWLHNVHLAFTGGLPEPHWAHYFALAAQCEVSGGYVAMAGYNAHLTVDLARSVAAVGSRPDNAGDYFAIVDAIASDGPAVVAATKSAYGVDFGPLWRFYFIGEGLDRVTGQGVGSRELLRVADLGVNVVIFSSGLALGNPATADAAAAEIDATWRIVDVSLQVLTRLGGL